MDHKQNAKKTESLHGGDIYRNYVDKDFSVNLNPCELPESFSEAIESSLGLSGNYPDPEYEQLRKAIAEMDSVRPENVICGNGASELIMAIVHAVKPEKALITAPCYAGYRVALEAAETEIKEYKLDEASGFELKPDFIDCLGDADIVFITDPNNPNGRLTDPSVKKKIITECSKKGITLVIDECFLPLTERGTESPAAGDMSIHLRAFTKTFAMPGLRLGYTVCYDSILNERIRRQIPEWNVSCIAEAAGIEAAAIAVHTDFISKSAGSIAAERAYLKDSLERLGIKTYPADSAYLLLKTGPGIYDSLLGKGILVRDCSNFSGLDERFIRIAVRSHDDNKELIEAIREIL